MNLDQFDMTRRPIGLRDRNKKEIYVGDVVEFYAGEPFLFSGYAIYRARKSGDLTLMRDVVVWLDGKAYFVCGFGGCLATRAAHVCRVIGQDISLVDTDHKIPRRAQK